jgi:hypothetical protein
LHDGEEGFRFDFDEDEEEVGDLRWCLVGRFLSERIIHFNSMKVRMADLWKPVKGVTIKEATGGKFLFLFAHPLDMEAVLQGGPWTFDNNMLLLEQVQLGMQIDQIPLFYADMWVQVHDLPIGLMKETVGVKLANYIGTFVEYDKNNKSSFWRQYMRLRVRIDVRLPLKKDTKVMNKEGAWCTVKFKYEKLGTFCFVCGVMGHAENKCEVRFSMEHDDGVRGWSADLRAEMRRQGGRLASRWLREERGGRSEQHGGARAGQSCSTVRSPTGHNNDADLAANSQNISQNGPTHNQSAIMTRQQQSLAINMPASHTPSPTLINKNASLTALNGADSTYAMHLETIPSILKLNNPSILVPNINSSSSSQPINPIYLNNPETETSKSHLLQYPSLTFNSQPLPVAPQPSKHSTHTKNPRAQPNKNNTNRTGPAPKSNPNPTLTRPEKKPKIITIRPEPNPNSSEPNQNQEDMEKLCEKKRRRDDEKIENGGTQQNMEHFLTAGPGSQACRDQ